MKVEAMYSMYPVSRFRRKFVNSCRADTVSGTTVSSRVPSLRSFCWVLV